jgi:magnesium-transporting ATPase (P-type)
MIQFISVLLLYTNRTNLGDTQFLYIDLVITTTVAVLMGRTGAYSRIVKQRPFGNLVAGATLMSIFSQILVSLAAQVIAVYYLQANIWNSTSPGPDPDDDDEQNSSTTTVFLVSSYQYLSLATVFSRGPPYRKPFYSNYLYLGALVVLTSFTTLLLLYPVAPLGDFFLLETLPWDFRLSVLMLVLVNTGVNIVIETLLESGTWVKRLSHFLTRKKKPKNAYKHVLQEISNSLQWPEDGATFYSRGSS